MHRLSNLNLEGTCTTSTPTPLARLFDRIQLQRLWESSILPGWWVNSTNAYHTHQREAETRIRRLVQSSRQDMRTGSARESQEKCSETDAEGILKTETIIFADRLNVE